MTKYIWTLLLFLNTSMLSATSIQEQYEALQSIESLEAYVEGLQQLANRLDRETAVGEAKTVGELYHDLGVSLFRLGNIQAAVNSFKEAIFYREHLLNNGDTDKVLIEGLVKGYTNIGNGLQYLGKYAEAESFLQTALKKQTQYEKFWKDPYRKAKAFHVLGQVQSEIRGFEQSLYAYSMALANYQLDTSRTSEQKNFRKAQIFNDLSVLFISWQEADSALHYANASIRIYKQLLDHPESIEKEEVEIGLASALLNAGYGYELSNQLKPSEKHFLQSLSMFQKIAPFYLDKEIVRVYHGLGTVYSKKHQFEKAHQILNEGIKINQQLINTYPYDENYYILLAAHQHKKGEIYLQQGAYADALQFQNSAIANLISDYDPLKLKQLTSSSTIIRDRLALLDPLSAKATILLQEGHLQQALEIFDASIELMNEMREDYRNIQSKIQLAKYAKQLYEGAIRTCMAMPQPALEKAFSYAEAGKAFTLLETVKHNKALIFGELEQELLDKEQQLRLQLQETKAYYLEEADPNFKAQLLETQKTLKDSLRQVVDILKQNPKYQQLNYGLDPIPVKAIQQQLLTENQILLEYFIGEQQSFLFALSKTGSIQVFPVDLTSSQVNQMVDSMWTGIYYSLKDELPDALKARLPEHANQELLSWYENIAYELFKKLALPVKEQLAGKQLLIIPDGALGYVPFDALLTTPDKSSGAYNYLGSDYPISYCYSATLLKEMKDHESSNARKKLLAFAPLEEFQYQVNGLEKVLNNSFLGSNFVNALWLNQANKQNLREKGSMYKYLHFSTHGKFNDKDPNYSYLMLKDQEEDTVSFLYLYEIYNIPLNSAMVVTSACEAGFGKLFRGEGIMSLARGFSAAGTQSMITTLWSINPGTTQQLLVAFYKQLKAGKTKDIALWKAKKIFLEANPNLNHPYYWAGLIPVGNMAPIEFPARPFWNWILPVVLIIGIPIFWLLRKMRKS